MPHKIQHVNIPIQTKYALCILYDDFLPEILKLNLIKTLDLPHLQKNSVNRKYLNDIIDMIEMASKTQNVGYLM